MTTEDLLLHPMRLRILQLLLASAQPVSPIEAARQLEPSLSTLSYHFRVLADAGVIRLAGTAQVRGATEHHYAIARRGLPRLRRAVHALDDTFGEPRMLADLLAAYPTVTHKQGPLLGCMELIAIAAPLPFHRCGSETGGDRAPADAWSSSRAAVRSGWMVAPACLEQAPPSWRLDFCGLPYARVASVEVAAGAAASSISRSCPSGTPGGKTRSMVSAPASSQ
jgi:DNA-binding transcriptional ArsR family regulator